VNDTEVKASIIYESIGFCAQQDFSFKNNTVYENLSIFAIIKGISKEGIDSILSIFLLFFLIIATYLLYISFMMIS